MSNAAEKPKVPKLRFPEFEGEWQLNQLKDAIKLIDSGWSPQCLNRPAAENEWGVLATTSTTWAGYSDQFNKALPDVMEVRDELEVKANDILITRAGPFDRVGVVAHVNSTRPKLMISDKIIRIRVGQEFDSAFVAMFLGRDRFQRYLHGTKSGLAEAQVNITQETLRNGPLLLPSLPEQKQVANFISQADAKVSFLEGQFGALLAYKDGMMQRLFSQELRFTSDDGSPYPDWDGKRLGDIAEIRKGEQRNKDTLADDGEYPVINGGVTPSGFTDSANAAGGTITISEGGNSCGHVAWQEVAFWLGGHCYAIEPASVEVSKKYLFQLLKYNQAAIMRLRVGSGLPNIQKGDLLKLMLKFPHQTEQEKIADFLSAIDERIGAVAKQIEATQRFKKGLLQQMFV